MEEIYLKLNDYLNDICTYLEKENGFFLEHLDSISKLNNKILRCLSHFSYENKTIQNHLSFEEVYLLAREIVLSIDENYLSLFDQLIESGELDFSFNYEYDDSECVTFSKKGITTKQIININRQFNYDDVCLLIHEFIHYTNGQKLSTNRAFFTEFLSIYFELYALDYLLNQGIPKEEIDYYHRLKVTKRHANILDNYTLVLLGFIKKGPLDGDTVSFLQKYFCKISEEQFNRKCFLLCKNLGYAEKKFEQEIKRFPSIRGEVIAEEFIARNYKYVLGTIMAIYVFKYGRCENVVFLNNHLHSFSHESIYDICLRIGIDYKDAHFMDKLFSAIEDYIKKFLKIQTPKK